MADRSGPDDPGAGAGKSPKGGKAPRPLSGRKRADAGGRSAKPGGKPKGKAGRSSAGSTGRTDPAAARAPSIVRCLTDRALDPGPTAAPGTGVRGDRPASDRVRPGLVAGRGSPPPSRVDDPIDAPTGALRTARTTRHPGLPATRIGSHTRVVGVRLARSNHRIDPAVRVRRIATDRRGIVAAHRRTAAGHRLVADRRTGDRARRRTAVVRRRLAVARRRIATDHRRIVAIPLGTAASRPTDRPGAPTARAVRRPVDRGSPPAQDRRPGLGPVSPSRHQTCSVPTRSSSPVAARSRRSSPPAGPRSGSWSCRNDATPSNSSSSTPRGCASRSSRSKAGR